MALLFILASIYTFSGVKQLVFCVDVSNCCSTLSLARFYLFILFAVDFWFATNHFFSFQLRLKHSEYPYVMKGMKGDQL